MSETGYNKSFYSPNENMNYDTSFFYNERIYRTFNVDKY